jgi:hypothetical protein
VEKFVREVPEHNGIGSEEDSMQSVRSLISKPPMKKAGKYSRPQTSVVDSMTMRFAAQFQTTHKDDAKRRFLVSYYIDDDTVSVFEKNQRNSGIRGGECFRAIFYLLYCNEEGEIILDSCVLLVRNIASSHSLTTQMVVFRQVLVPHQASATGWQRLLRRAALLCRRRGDARQAQLYPHCCGRLCPQVSGGCWGEEHFLKNRSKSMCTYGVACIETFSLPDILFIAIFYCQTPRRTQSAVYIRNSQY